MSSISSSKSFKFQKILWIFTMDDTLRKFNITKTSDNGFKKFLF